MERAAEHGQPVSMMIAVLAAEPLGPTGTAHGTAAGSSDDLAHRHAQLVERTMHTRAGRPADRTGPWLLATFDSCTDALACASVLQETSAGFVRSNPGCGLSVRIGVAVGEATHDEAGWSGSPVVMATTVAARAAPDEILATDPVRQLAACPPGSELVPAGAADPPGLEHPIDVCRLVRPHAAAGQPSLPSPGAPIPFVGRDGERAILDAVWSRVATGQHKLVLLGGEPGVGKSYLAAEFARQQREGGATVLAGRCDDEPAVPYQPFIEAFRQLVAAVGPDAVRAAGTPLARLVPELYDGINPSAGSLVLDPETERYWLFEAVLAALRTAAALAPVVLLLEDLQWASAPTLMLIRHLVQAVAPLRLAMVGTYRDIELDSRHPLSMLLGDLRTQHNVERIALRGLSATEVAALVAAARAREAADLDDGLSAALHDHTGGNPFFIGQMLRHLVEVGIVVSHGDRFVLARPLDDVGLPDSVRDVLHSRLYRLNNTTREILAVAALTGVEFDYAVLAAARRRGGGPGEDDVDVLDALDAAVKARIVEEVPTPLGRYRFAHALVRDVVVDDLTATRRTMLHLRIAKAIEHAGGQQREDVAALAHHFAEAAALGADIALKAAEYALAAGRRAIEQLASEEAVALADRGLSVLGPQAESHIQMVAELKGMKAEAVAVAHEYYGVPHVAGEAVASALRADDPVLLARAAILASYWRDFGPHPEFGDLIGKAFMGLPENEVTLGAQLRCVQLLNQVLDGEPVAVTAIDDAYAAAVAAGDVGALRVASDVRTWAHHATGDVGAEREHAHRLLAEAERVGDPRGLTRALTLLGRVHLLEGDRAAFESTVARQDEASRRFGSRDAMSGVAAWRATAAMADGRLADALQHMDEALASYPDHPGAQGAYLAQLIMLRHEEGRLAELIPVLELAVEQYPNVPSMRAWLALALLHAGEAAEVWRQVAFLTDDGLARLAGTWAAAPGLAALAEVAGVADRAGMPEAEGLARLVEPRLVRFSGQLMVTVFGLNCAGAADRLLGICATVLGRYEQAEHRFGAALALEDGFDGPALAARTRYWWARMLVRRNGTGDTDRALVLLGDAAPIAAASGMAELDAAIGSLRAHALAVTKR